MDDTAGSVPVLSDGQDMRQLAEQATAVDPRSMEELDHQPQVLKAYTVYPDPKITVIPNFLKDEEIQHLLSLAEAYWVPSTVGSGVYTTNDEKDLRNKQSKTRTSFSCMLRSAQTEVVQAIEHRLAHLAGIQVQHLERLNMVRYSPGQLFNRHHDGRFRPKTVFVYLNDLPENDGGETFFPDLGLKFVPRKGAAVMWSNVLAHNVEDNRTIHLGMPPRTSTKYGVNCFFNDKPLREWEAAAKLPGQVSAIRQVDPTALLKDQDLQPGLLRAFVVNEDPKVRVIPEMLSQHEVDCLLKALQPEGPAVDAECIASIEQRMAAVAGRPWEQLEGLRVAKCTSDMTPDGVDLTDQQYLERFGVSVVFIFLNEAEAADLCFPSLGLQITPRAACAVVWSTSGMLRHQAQPPRSGTRFAALGVFRDAPVNRLE